jgi:hypothetical protein
VNEQVTLATSTGLPWLSLVFHIGAGAIALVAGFIAVAVRKGGGWHRKSGVVFVYAMIAMGMTGAGIAVYEGKGTVIAGLLTAYLVFTAWTAVRPLPWAGRRVQIALTVLAFTIAAAEFTFGSIALGRPGNQINGVPAGAMLFMGTVVLLAAVGDVRMLRAGGLQGSRRLARHLWRMCFALFIASGSFFLGQLKVIPEPIRIMPLILLLAFGPLLLLLYWMWRVRLRQNLRGMLTAKPIEARRAA